jgi:hypothetical protein
MGPLSGFWPKLGRSAVSCGNRVRVPAGRVITNKQTNNETLSAKTETLSAKPEKFSAKTDKFSAKTDKFVANLSEF